MTNAEFSKGVAILNLSFRDLKLSKAQLELMFSLLKEYEFRFYEKAVISFCKEVTELYPNSNITAHLIKSIKEQKSIDSREWKSPVALSEKTRQENLKRIKLLVSNIGQK